MWTRACPASCSTGCTCPGSTSPSRACRARWNCRSTPGTTTPDDARQGGSMSALLDRYCKGYALVPIIEACTGHGLFARLDRSEFRARRGLIDELEANAGYFTIALHALESAGWLEKNGNDAYRR